MVARRGRPTDRFKEAAQLERDLAHEALKSGDRESAWRRLHGVLARLAVHDVGHEDLFISASLEFSSLCFVLGQGFNEAVTFLQAAKSAAGRQGDSRSHALINLHLARLYYFSERRQSAVEAFEEGKAEAEGLGDEDILDQSAEFIGLYYFIQGMFLKAQPYFERATQSFETEKWFPVVNPSGPMWLCYCTAFLGQYHRAIGTVDYYRRLALEKSDRTLATTLRTVLGIILLGIKKYKEAAFHFKVALQEAAATDNALAKYFATGGMGYYHFAEGRLEEAREWSARAVTEGAGSGMIRQYASPIFLEAVFKFHRLGLEPITELSFHRELQRLIQEPNIHLKGVCLRLRAVEAFLDGEDGAPVESDLKESERLLLDSGDPIQLAKTRIEMARLRLRQGDPEGARSLAQKAWKGFSGYGDLFYPDDLRHLLAAKTGLQPRWDARAEFPDRFAEVIQELSPSADLDALLSRTVAATNRFFGAERGGIFWFNRGRVTQSHRLRAACNLTQADAASEDFRSNLALVFKAFRENRPQVVRLGDSSSRPNQVKAILCVPFGLEGHTQGVLYHDNSYAYDCFDCFEKSQLLRIANSLTSYINQVYGFVRSLEKKRPMERPLSEHPDVPEMVTQDPGMIRLLAQADRLAASESTVLILGETGVGKELLAQRLHFMSPRRERALVTVDPATIPETLIESELFGYERGAFTGAENRKTGRLEMAHRGTLFIDEVGEIPKSVQVKFLRALQEKTLVRVGGAHTIYSDFRLVAATNRDLAKEVAAGRFREDLYYRINVVPLTIPPLRERKGDISLLAEYFLDRYVSKHGRAGTGFAPEDDRRLTDYPWPGNVRELKNVIERAVILSMGDYLDLDLPAEGSGVSGHPFKDAPTLDEIQRRYIRFVLEMTGGKVGGPGGAAEILGMKRTSLNNRMKKLGIR